MPGILLRSSILTAALAGSLFALDPAKSLTQYAHRIGGHGEGLFQPTVFSIAQTRDGFLWLGTQDSLIRSDGAHFRNFERDGKLWFATTNDLVTIDPSRLGRALPPPAAVTAVFIDGRRFDPSHGLHLKPGEKNLEIRYAGLSFVAPHVYQRAWFVPAVAAIILIAIAALYRRRIRHLQKSFDLVLAERTRIARELHDTLLQGLSGVTMQLQALWSRLPASPERQMLGAIIGDAGRCCSEARRSVWDLRNDGETPYTLSAKLAKLAREAVAGSGISLKLELEPLTIQLAPEVEQELLRIAREAIANVLLHAQASRVTVSGRVAAGRLRIVVEDNGVGFVASGPRNRTGHFGITGMQERAGGIGAELEIGASPGGGTRVALGLPLGSHRTGNPKGALAHP